MPVIHAIYAWAATHWFITSVVLTWLINDVRNATTDHPQVQSFLGMLLDIISAHPHSDAKGSLKWPGTRSKLPEGKRRWQRKTRRVPPALPPASILLCFALMGPYLQGCCVFHGTCKEGSAGDCVSKVAKGQFPHLLPILAGLLMHGTTNLAESLALEGITVSPDLLSCLVLYIQDSSQARLVQIASGKLTAETPPAWLQVPVADLQKMRDSAAVFLKGAK